MKEAIRVSLLIERTEFIDGEHQPWVPLEQIKLAWDLNGQIHPLDEYVRDLRAVPVKKELRL